MEWLKKLPKCSVLAQNIGLKQGEIMEIRVPLEVLMHTDTLVQLSKTVENFGLYRNQKMMELKPSIVLKPK